ncbi:pyridoxal phosphate-dependent aminotransferase EpsN [Hasllibacter halocynthiae]|uniref:Pyridoxal phosphate-dependent aminotransferase EpsN n=1 Tax=Hasllibacter halocynthiae TaxID=595589 RepID=A0A2T0X2K8_9RHOB|nr:aminotransferase class I/II-fold pyridoxal phosphate-dependent enzyme [Hasllibacter halocynthiae]PRY93147.1 pyridoxal phosphate-dependent aminotransferase EpsN [Hasllibacter halocynthiae]
MRIWLSRPHMSGGEEAAVAAAFASGFVAPAGPQLDAFEGAVAAHLGGGVHCVALSSGTAALHLALRLAGVGPGDEVWISSMTFAGGVFPVRYLGASPRFFDLDPARWTLSLPLLEEEMDRAARRGRLPKAVVPTDLYGASVDLPPLEALCARHGVALVVDSAEALGARCGDRAAGTGGDAAVLSFNGNKIVTTSGGGMLVTRHAEWAARARFLATQAREAAPHYEHETIGYNYRLSNVCAAIGLAQMGVLGARVARRRAIFARYRDALSPAGIAFMPEAPGHLSTRWLTACRIDPARTGTDREAVRLALLSEGIEARPLWKPMHLQPVFAGAPYHGAGFDAALFADGLCLPSGSDMTEAEQDEVIARVLAVMA